MVRRFTQWTAILLALSLILGGCGSAGPGEEPGVTPPGLAASPMPPQAPQPTPAPLAPQAPIPTPTPLPPQSPIPSPTTLSPESPIPTPAQQSGQLIVLHTNDNWGETLPCGWGKSATGGFRRRATYVKQQRELGIPLLLLDTGDALVMDALQGSEVTGEKIVAGMNLMGYDAMALGPKELALGAAALQQRLDQAQFGILSANAVWRETGELVARPYLILDLGLQRVGIIGLTRQLSVTLAGVEVLDPEETLSKTVPEVASQAETVILLTNLPFEDAQGLAKAVPDLDLVVAALPGYLPDRAVRIAETGALVVVADQPSEGHSGRRVGRLQATLGSDGSLGGESWISVPMGPEFADDPEMADLLQKYP